VHTDIEERARDLAAYIIENKATVRAAAARFGVSKSTVHKDMSERLEQIDRALWLRVRAILELNKAERHIRGGLATRKKYRGE
jgi:putative DeoR family transcriptional regulator (stage III sporulation protein D)